MYKASNERYDNMQYKRCGKSGLLLPRISVGLWHNFGTNADLENCKKIIQTAFDNGVTHFDLANNYGPEAGSAEINFGKILSADFKGYRDELIVSTKAGYYMWAGPYGEYGSKKYLTASLDQSLKRMGLDYVDIFYHHRPDENTPLEETAGALDLIVRQGKALYIGVSNYSAGQTKAIAAIFKRLGTPFIIHQPCYNMLDRWIENGLTDVLEEEGLGCIAFSPLAQGILTNRYFSGYPADSRVGNSIFLPKERVEKNLSISKQLNEIAVARSQTLAQTALSWLLAHDSVTSVIIGVSKAAQLKENLAALDNLTFTTKELSTIDKIIGADKKHST
ncbi:MAG: L-glyceraldehyde 3-phosphate reductase [Clostridiaceae bacterium]|jgi:L-glyceraldehyde 3-phosphate reductase|nr:L-glyceraldehyde 3-phosphate reductase [Clostridiaceae bacterium]